ncbi:MAG TPA: hypothetical protein PLK34_02385 [Candidatus Pacearchaeota archaeon]|nr:hypothetical protein [Candidatus Pacearchaeota archaeon]
MTQETEKIGDLERFCTGVSSLVAGGKSQLGEILLYALAESTVHEHKDGTKGLLVVVSPDEIKGVQALADLLNKTGYTQDTRIAYGNSLKNTAGENVVEVYLQSKGISGEY